MVSSDQNEAAFDDYFESMPWVAVPYKDNEQRQRLTSMFGVKGVPYLVIVNANDGTVKDEDGRTTVYGARHDVTLALDKWK